jgi:hypothetical protein
MAVPAAHRNYAAVRDVADHIFELDSRVVNVELIRQKLVHPAQDSFALRWRNILNADMAGKSVGI